MVESSFDRSDIIPHTVSRISDVAIFVVYKGCKNKNGIPTRQVGFELSGRLREPVHSRPAVAPPVPLGRHAVEDARRSKRGTHVCAVVSSCTLK